MRSLFEVLAENEATKTRKPVTPEVVVEPVGQQTTTGSRSLFGRLVENEQKVTPITPVATEGVTTEPTRKIPDIPDIPDKIPLTQLSEEPEIANIESQFYSATDPRSKAQSLKAFPQDKGAELLSTLPEEEQANIRGELEKLHNEDRKSNAFALGILQSTPVPTFLPKETKEELERVREAAPLRSAAGQIVGTIGQAIAGGQVVGGALNKIAPIAKSPLLRNALTRVTVAGGIAAEQNIGRKKFSEAVQDVAQQSGGGLLSLVPEILAPPGVAQVIAQPLTDLVYDVVTDKIRGKDVGTKEWWKNEIISLASSAGFAIRDVASGKTFEAEQAAQRSELKNFLNKNKDADIEIIEVRTPETQLTETVEPPKPEGGIQVPPKTEAPLEPPKTTPTADEMGRLLETPEERQIGESFAKEIGDVTYQGVSGGITPNGKRIALLEFKDNITGGNRTISPDQDIDVLRKKINSLRESEGKYAEGVGRKTEKAGKQKEGLEPGAEAGVHLRGTEKNRMEAGPGKEITEEVKVEQPTTTIEKRVGETAPSTVRPVEEGEASGKETIQKSEVTDEGESREGVVRYDETPEQTVTEPLPEIAAPYNIEATYLDKGSMSDVPNRRYQKINGVWYDEGDWSWENNVPKDKVIVDINEPIKGKHSEYLDKKAKHIVAPAKPEEPGITEKITGMEEQPSPLTMGGIAAGQELPKYAGNINLERIDADYDPKRAILETSANYEGKIDEARRGKITQEETRKLADDLGMTEKDLLKRKRGQAFNAEQVLAARDWLNASATRIIELQKNIATKRSEGVLTDNDIANFSLELKKHAAIQAEVAGITAEAGRALNSFKIMSKAKKEAKGVEEILDVAGGKEINEEILDKLMKIDPENAAALNKFVRKSVFAKTADAVYEYWINAILSAPTTHMVNFTSNTATGLYRTLLEKPAAAAIDRAVSRIQKRPVERYFGEVPAELNGFIQGLPEAVGAFKETWKTGIPATGTKLEGIKPEGAIPGNVGKVIRTPTRFLSAADEFFKTVIYRGTLNSLAYRKAKAEGKTGVELKNRVSEILQEPSKAMMEKAKGEAAYRTFTNPLGGFGKSVMNMRRKTPGLKYIIPFIKTPTNIAKFALERTPGVSQAIEVAKIRKGDVKVAQISDEVAKGAVGSMLALTAVALAKDGLITGGGPKEKKERDSLYRTGWIPYSVKLGDRYYSFSRLEPIASVIGMAADFATMNIDEMSDDQLTDIATKISLSFGKNITSKTFMQGVSNLLDAISDPKRYGERWINRMAGSVIPNIIAAGARATDDELKQINSINETVMSRIPGLTQQIKPRRNIWGEEIIKTATGLEAFLSPIQVSKESENEIDKELLRLDYNPSMPSSNIRHRGESIVLDPKVYDVYSEHVGKYAKALIQNDLKSRRYIQSIDEKKIDIIKQSFDNARKRYRENALMMQINRNRMK